MTAPSPNVDLAIASPVVLLGLTSELASRGVRVETAVTSWVEFSRSWAFSAGHVLVDAYLDDHVPLLLKVRALRREGSRVAVLGRHPDGRQAGRAMRDGADLWLTPEDNLETTGERLARWARSAITTDTPSTPAGPQLTDRELQVLCLYASRRGHPVTEVGKILGLSPETIRTHLRTGRAKMTTIGHDVGTRSRLERALVDEGIVEDVTTWREMRRW